MRCQCVAIVGAMLIACWSCGVFEIGGLTWAVTTESPPPLEAETQPSRNLSALQLAPQADILHSPSPSGRGVDSELVARPPRPAVPKLVPGRKERSGASENTPVVRLQTSVILMGLCAAPVLNCTGEHARPLIMSAMRHAAPQQEGTTGNTSSPRQPLKAYVTMETGQRMKVLLPPAVLVPAPSLASVTVDSAIRSMCRSGVHVAHFMVGHYHLNLMHTMMRVVSLQRAILEVLRDVNSACNGRSVALRVLIVPRVLPRATPTPFAGIGFYQTLAPLLGRVAQWQLWPYDADVVCNASTNGSITPNECRSFVSFQHDYVQFYESKGAHPLTKESLRLVRQNANLQWRLQGAGEASTIPLSVVIVNRRTSRRVKNVQDVVDAVDLLVNASERTVVRALNIQIRVVELEDLPVVEQARLFAHASVVVAVHGAALAWSLLMKANSSLLELVPPGWSFLRRDQSMFQLFSDAASVRDHIMLFLRQRSGSVLNDAFSRNFTLHGKDVQKIASWIVHAAA